LQTVFYPIYALHDRLEVLPTSSPNIRLHNNGIQVDCNTEENIVVKCYRLLKKLFPVIGGVEVTLDKHIPFGAGLGGGSSDAAFMAMALNRLYDLQLSREQLTSILRQLGADCPFFLYNTPCYATGIGDVLSPIEMNLSGKYIVMVKPQVSVSTREAYTGVKPDGKEYKWHENTNNISSFINDFETSVFTLHPELAIIKESLIGPGAFYAAMSGSGSTIYGLYDTTHFHNIQTTNPLWQSHIAPHIIYSGAL
jgi:4-diphosphocytidyl-2-C-methyl-D-erythritol kinase